LSINCFLVVMWWRRK